MWCTLPELHYLVQIKVEVDLPGVGQNLHDHAAVTENIFFDQHLPMLSLSTSDITVSNIINYLRHGTG